MNQNDDCTWYWLPEWNAEKETSPVFVYFRKEIELEEKPEHFTICMSADSRYKLYVNQKLAEAGPSKGNDQIWYYDELDIAPLLKNGRNILAVAVLHYPVEHYKGNFSTFRTKTPGLYTNIKGDWICRRAEHIQIVSENPWFAPMQIYERAAGNQTSLLWMHENYDAADWKPAREYGTDETEIKNLSLRTIPFLRKIKGKFREISKQHRSDYSPDEWKDFLQEKRTLLVPSNTVESVDIDAGELMTGYLQLRMAQGAGAEITLLQAECYAGERCEHEDPFKRLPRKGDRTDAVHGDLYGNEDFYLAFGGGTEGIPEVYEPFWFRTFRYIRLRIETKEEPLQLLGFDYTETGYPLEIQSWGKASDSSLDGVWDISARTLRRCMFETYVDCPFYEQLQYAMDSRSQMLFTYATAADDRLARKCMEDFRQSALEDGMIQCSYPNYENNVIPGFSIYYIGMLYDHMMYFGDRELIEKHMPVVEGILNYFNSRLDESGIVGKIGGLNKPDNYWSFIDWTKEWDKTDGVPPVTLDGPITMESLLYVLGLQYAAELADYLGQNAAAECYRKAAVNAQQAVNRCCKGINGMYQDGPGMEAYSQHTQVFAILTDTVSIEAGRALLEETLINSERYAQCSVAMMFYLFRALEKCGLYHYTNGLWDIWRTMVDNNLTTCAEDPISSRSDCHAWGSLLLYEMPASILGVRPVKPGCGQIMIQPHTEWLSWAKGEVMTPKGKIEVAWEKQENEEVKLTIHCPDGMEICYDHEGRSPE
ncbi:alpha-L-rhamnosidase-related protein [Anaerobium acetethylicum]|uniref:Alpha-L-rhamnosidase n=1 Tax=Anaerobium acetethylicum TaxID=1619234 RepID=A0A1D3TNE0_9FIRM|nr:alpha-L-rhamnosidase C-terminal domain-containing protein [Anaerobium acetethylicum]SCP94846.1 alpha-L-rhamnosidase [Anaerobium acetethylicum]